MFSGKNILLGVTGGIAAYKVATLTRILVKAGADVKIIMTPAAKEFITPLTLSTLSKNPVLSKFSHTDTGEWNSHVELGLWADVMVIAPATANTIGKMANGLCDNLLIATYLSARCPVFVAPAMDLDMYMHPTTKNNIEQLKTNGNHIINAAKGELASGLTGEGRMEEPELIVEALKDFFFEKQELSNKKVLITAGPTHEAIDPVRFIGNRSSGKMGYELALKAQALGADVTLVMGPTQINTVDGFNRIDVTSAAEMYQAVMDNYEEADVIIMSAAVADYTPSEVSEQKMKKKTDELSIELVPTRDILRSVGEIKKDHQLLVGFALETDNEQENAIGKLRKKNLDFIVLNSLNDKGAGFGTDTNKITIIDKDNNIEEFQLKSKSDVATDVFNKIISLTS